MFWLQKNLTLMKKMQSFIHKEVTSYKIMASLFHFEFSNKISSLGSELFNHYIIISFWISEKNLKPWPTVQKRRVVIALGRHSKKKEALEWRRLKINLHCFQQERLAIAW